MPTASEHLSAFGVMAEERVETRLEAVSQANPQMIRIVWDGDEITLEIEEDYQGAVVLVYLATGWRENVNSPEVGGGVSLLQYFKLPGQSLTQYAVLGVVSQGDILLIAKNRKQFELEFNDDGSLLAEDDNEGDLEDEDDEED